MAVYVQHVGDISNDQLSSKMLVPKMRHGYYLAATQERHGDPEFSAQAKRIWFGRVEVNVPGRYDGVSVFERPDGTTCKRITIQSFFSEKLDVKVFDL